jgi:hypothetical protein
MAIAMTQAMHRLPLTAPGPLGPHNNPSPLEQMPPTSIARQSLEQLRAAFISAVARGDWNVALHNAEKALSIVGDHPTVIGALALCQSRLGRLEEALKNYRIATSLAPDDFNLFDGLAVACGHAGDSIGARAAGMTALTLRDKQRRAQTWRLPATLPPPLSNDRSRNVIAYSVFGSDPKYCETAVLNVSAARAAFPCWTTRFYLDISSTPPNIAHRLRAAGAEVVETSRESLGGLPPLLWRFQVMDDPAVDRWLIRDADSLLSVREAVAVQDWLSSDAWHHVMRDYFSHTELLLAGLIGGCGGIYHGVADHMRDFATSWNKPHPRFLDQHFLRDYVWPTARESLATHDSLFGFHGGRPFPPHPDHGYGAKFHVGSNFASDEICVRCGTPTARAVAWRLFDTNGTLICAYDAPVFDGEWRAALPKTYIDRLRAGDWRLEAVAKQ